MWINSKDLFHDFIGLIFPKVCVACNRALLKHEEWICYWCRHRLPRAYFHKSIETSLIRKTLYGRVPVVGSAAYYLFSKKSGVQNILHFIKYKNGKALAQQIGQWMAKELMESDWFKEVDALVPIPLHPQKQLERGYNQSEEYCYGITKMTPVPVMPILKKNIYTTTQTKKKKYERWENVKNNFDVAMDINHFKHLALVDDVMTTGATFESAYSALSKAGYNGKISIITIAVATHLI